MTVTPMSAHEQIEAGRRAANAGERRTARLLIALALVSTAFLIAAPLVYIFWRAFAAGVGGYWAAITTPDTLHAIWLTVIVTVIVVPVNVAFGIAVAWAIARFRFPGRGLLMTIVEIPFSISPIIAGICYLLLYGRQGFLGPFLREHDITVLFALPGIVLVTLFVTAPFVAREVLPLMLAKGSEQEEAAVTLGARGWQVFRYVTLPGIRWALLYGAVLCAARAVGEFGGVSVVSGRVAGQTNTLPLQIELLYNEMNTSVAAFAAASTLTMIAIIALIAKTFLDSHNRRG
ncbi:sulfate ABC transporter permease subunit CysW [Pseudomonas sp. GX19020]|uniref:sulfate ABC transporter permease subunit CysW n=1 Tax=Pseudomonas sp. GX19020 TaxID=2942277 RepID=UPI00201A2112|nr:sulfate ABC transporter permease subunit CysW [Pseudomonas sp. GX19020]MCL4068458.1 sulfate ABC transporter permease subunit CysW [Pseudomonas sp. GX19020]